MFGSLDTISVRFAPPMLFPVRLKKSGAITPSIAGTETITEIVLFYIHARTLAGVRWARADQDIEAQPEQVSHR